MKLKRLAKLVVTAVAAFAPTVLSQAAFATKIADITRIEGQQNNVLTGLGLVYGLKGTGDGGDFGPAMRPLQRMLEQNGNYSALAELKDVQNVALVTITATLPSHGVRPGDQVDIRIMSMGKASSLKGGHLIMSPMRASAGGTSFGYAEGPVAIEDTTMPTVGIVQKGMHIEQELIAPVVKNHQRITFIIDDSAASWGTASIMAKTINEGEGVDGTPIAQAVDARTVEVIVPPSERSDPAAFIARVQRLPMQLMPQEARVVINTKSGLIVLTGDVEISPVVISYKGLSIQAVTPKPVPSPKTPVVTVQSSVPVETGDSGGAKLRDLVTAFEQLKVPAEDRINIVREIHKTGKLHAKLIVDGVMP